MQNSEKCSHQACGCKAAPGSKYCSQACEDAGAARATSCPCGHSGCVATAGAGGMSMSGR